MIGEQVEVNGYWQEVKKRAAHMSELQQYQSQLRVAIDAYLAASVNTPDAAPAVNFFKGKTRTTWGEFKSTLESMAADMETAGHAWQAYAIALAGDWSGLVAFARSQELNHG